MTLRVCTGPTSVGGVVMRLMTDGDRVWSEMWGPDGWVKAGTVRDCMFNPRASPELLLALGIPPSDWVWPERERNPPDG